MRNQSSGLRAEQLLFIVNPTSARGTTRRMWAEARRELLQLGIAFTEHVTSRPGEAVTVTRQALRQGVSRVVAVGGDGTLNEVVNGYLDADGQAVNPSASLGLLPSGTGSDFRRSLGLKANSEALSALTSSHTIIIDAARAVFRDQHGADASRCFINVASCGLGGEVAALVNQWRLTLPRWLGGRARFLAAAVSALRQYRNVPVRVRLDGEREFHLNSNLLVAANGRFAGGGMMLAPWAELNDGLLDVILIAGATRLDVLKELPRIQRGAYLENPKVTATRARELTIISDVPLALDLDGEPVGYTPMYLTVLPSAIRFAAGSLHQGRIEESD
jgi:diacylglycerol kinase (ATP)